MPDETMLRRIGIGHECFLTLQEAQEIADYARSRYILLQTGIVEFDTSDSCVGLVLRMIKDSEFAHVLDTTK